MEKILRCPFCVPRYRVARVKGWVAEAPYVGFLIVDRRYDTKMPPRSCPTCGTPLIRVAE